MGGMALQEKAHERQVANLLQGSEVPSDQICAIGDTTETGRSTAIAAERFGVGQSTVERAVRVIEHGGADGKPLLVH